MKNLNEVYEGKLVSNDSYKATAEKEFQFQLVVSVIDLDSACGEPGFLITVDAAKLPKYLTRKQRKDVADTCCIEPKEVQVTDIVDYGISAPMDSFTVLTWKEAETKLEEIDNKIPTYGGLCGFYFDRRANMIGNTGWDFISGNIGFSNK